jgi:hypothetical protein
MMTQTPEQIEKRKALVALLRNAEKVEDADLVWYWKGSDFGWLFRVVYRPVSREYTFFPFVSKIGNCGCAVGVAFHFSLISKHSLGAISEELGFEESEARRIFYAADTYINEHSDDGRTSVFDQVTPYMVADELEKSYRGKDIQHQIEV